MVGYKDYFRQETAKLPEGESLYIALPIVLLFILICVCGGCIINRKRRQISLGNVMGRKKGYGIGKSRSQRLGHGKKVGGDDIMLRDQELNSNGKYSDIPKQQQNAGSTYTGFDFGNFGTSPIDNAGRNGTKD